MPNRDQRGRTRAATYARRTLLGRPTLRCWRRSFENVAMVRIDTVKRGMTVPPYVVVWALLIVAWAANFVIRVGFSALLPSIIDESRPPPRGRLVSPPACCEPSCLLR